MKLTKNKSKQIAQQAIQEEQQLNRAAASLICLIKFSLTHEGIKTSMQTYLSTENKPS